jgi:hypothetical protein
MSCLVKNLPAQNENVALAKCNFMFVSRSVFSVGLSNVTISVPMSQ